jgi:hypothetical protein
MHLVSPHTEPELHVHIEHRIFRWHIIVTYILEFSHWSTAVALHNLANSTVLAFCKTDHIHTCILYIKYTIVVRTRLVQGNKRKLKK